MEKVLSKRYITRAISSLPTVAGTPKTLRFFVRPCCRRYAFGGILRFFLFIYIALYSVFSQAYEDLGEYVPFSRLVASPASFEGKVISVRGVLFAAELHTGGGPLTKRIYLFPSVDSARYFNDYEAIFLDTCDFYSYQKLRNEVQMKYVEVTGRFKTLSVNSEPMGRVSDVCRLFPVKRDNLGQGGK